MLAYTNSRLLAFIGVNFVILFSYLPYISFFCPTMMHQYPVFTIIMQIFVTIGATMVEVTYFFAVFSDPGYLNSYQRFFTSENDISNIKNETKDVKEKIVDLRKRIKNAKFEQADLEASQNTDITTMQREINKIYLLQLKKQTYCFICDMVKPVRTHHCKTCKKCVQRMDHHCPWTGNCVGVDNVRYFIQFLFYASFTLFVLYGVSLFVYAFSKVRADEVSDLVIKANCIFSMVIGFAIGYLFFYQIKNSFINLTTVEDNIENVSSIKPFDLGKRENLEEVFGPGLRVKYIFLPLAISNKNKEMVSN